MDQALVCHEGINHFSILYSNRIKLYVYIYIYIYIYRYIIPGVCLLPFFCKITGHSLFDEAKLAKFQKDQVHLSSGKWGGWLADQVQCNVWVPSGNQTWQWKMDHLLVILLLKPPFIEDFPLPCLITRGYLRLLVWPYGLPEDFCTVFKHYPSTCSSTCAGQAFWYFPDDET